MSARRPSRINPDARATLVVAVVLTVAIALVSFLLSFHGLADAAAWANVPAWLSWSIPGYVDGSILVYTVAALVFRGRGESARLAWAALALFGALSVVANGVHAWPTAPEALRVALGITLAGLAPVAVLLTTHTIARLVVAPPTLEAASAEEVAEEPAETPALIPGADSLAPMPPAPFLDLWAAKLADDKSAPKLAAVPTPKPSSKATDERNARIRARAEAAPELSVRDIATEFGVSKSTVSRILRRPDDVVAA